MKSISRRFLLLVVPVLLVLWLAVLFAKMPVHPVAYIRVVDASGNPLAGAVVQPEGLRTKPGPYVSGWYGWGTATDGGVANPPVTTDQEGYARVPYPKSTAPPAGAPWRVRVDDLLKRILRKALISRPDPVVLEKGAMLILRVDDAGKGGHLIGQVSGHVFGDTNFWIRPEPGVLVTRRLSAGPHTVRAVQVEADGAVWFSDTLAFTAVARQTNELAMNLKRGATVRGELDATVPRPVKNGRVVANIWPLECKPQDSPPQWHSWAKVDDDGTFSIPSLPEGDLEVVAMCDGFISTNGPGQFQTRYPQKHMPIRLVDKTRFLDILAFMEKTPEQLLKEAAEHDAKLQEHSAKAQALRAESVVASPALKTESQQVKGDGPDPVTGFYPKKPQRTKWGASEICGDADKEEKDGADSPRE